jgi:predicted GH43/DUF377 family glycosyl hydrolase
MSDFELQRIGVVMEPRPGDAMEAEGVLNPASARAKDGKLYLFPRLVGRGNYSRIGIARVLFDDSGDPVGVERLGIALEPEADYEKRPGGGGGCEDPRITFVEPLGHYVMTYTAFSARGPRIAIAVSDDLMHWRRLGLVSFHPYRSVAFEGVDDKDASVFPVEVPDAQGRPAMAMIHRPLFAGTRPEETGATRHPHSRRIDLNLESIWISYCRMGWEEGPNKLSEFGAHHRLASPVERWEALKIGGGAPPILTRHGWLLIYHGVHKIAEAGTDHDKFCYSAGVMVLSEKQPSFIRYRGAEPILVPSSEKERHGIVDNVVFPTAIDRRDDIGQPDRLDVYYGMADRSIGVARLTVPAKLQLRSIADPPADSRYGPHTKT